MISIHAPFLLRAPVLRRIKASQCPVARKAPFRGLLRPTSGLLALALWALAAPLSAEAPAAHPAPRPAPGPALVAPLLNGQPFDLAAQHGHVVVVHLWASWCPPCRAEMPLLDRFARSYGEVMVLGLSFDKKRD